MLIRSQDKKMLVNSNCVEVLKNMVVAYSGEFRHPLGEYKTQERAVEVLDQIEQRLMEGHRTDVIVGGTRVYRENVFEMPEK